MADAGPSQQPPVRRGQASGRSTMPSYVRFYNRTNRHVDVIWLNYEGLGVRYRTLPPRNYLDVNTFVGHPWIFRDSITGDRCVAQFKDVYEPHADVEGPARRRVVNITIPVFRLKERCLQVVRSLTPRHAVCKLEIPQVLQAELLSTLSDHDISMAPSAPSVNSNHSGAHNNHSAPANPRQLNPYLHQPGHVMDASPASSRLLNPRTSSQLAQLLVPSANGSTSKDHGRSSQGSVRHAQPNTSSDDAAPSTSGTNVCHSQNKVNTHQSDDSRTKDSSDSSDEDDNT